MIVSTLAARSAMPRVGVLHAALALEEERPRHDAHRERAHVTRDLRDDRRRAGARAAAHAGGDEDHVRALERVLDALHLLERALLAHVGVRAGAEATREARPELHLRRREVRLERLRVGVGRDELHALEAALDHRVERVAATTADAHHLDARLHLVAHVREFDVQTHDRLPGRRTDADGS
jgi:hypothetical protein